MDKLVKSLITACKILSLSFVLILLAGISQITYAQVASINWDTPINISRTPNSTSTDPFLLADPGGRFHLFWAEKASDGAGNVPDTIMYSAWDGRNWTNPIDIHYSPPSHGNQIANYPHAVIDDEGTIHLIWLTQPNFPNYAVYYSRVYAPQAGSVNAWTPPVALASDLTGTNYSIDLKLDNQQCIHVIYSRVPAGDTPPELRATSYIRSSDSGLSWSEPLDIFTVSVPTNGTSNTRLLIDDKDHVYASWSVWNLSGNGQAIHFSRSLDGGSTWETPILLSERIGNEYERDWNNMASLGEDRIVSMWEGGYRAYRHVQYSSDNGITWSEPVDIFPGLIGENGFAEFVRDGSGNLHVFLSQRSREGNFLSTGKGLWHSVWEEDRGWRDAILTGGDQDMLNPKIAIVNGNQIAVTWYTSPDYEIIVRTGHLTEIPEIQPQPWPDFQPEQIDPPMTSLPDTPLFTSTAEPQKGTPQFETTEIGGVTNPASTIFLGILPSILFVGIGIAVYRRRQR
jgi:hypothetical protein